MRDSTGVNWLAHFLHGTSTMLLLLGPTVLTTPSEKNAHCQAFFFSARVFELSRALIYTEHTFLSTSEWSAAIESYWVQNRELRTPKEALFDITPLFGELGMRVLDFVDAAGGMSVQKQVCFARALALEGLSLQETLLRWHAHSSLHSLIENAAKTPSSPRHTTTLYPSTSTVLFRTTHPSRPPQPPKAQCSTALVSTNTFSAYCLHASNCWIRGVRDWSCFSP